MEKKKTNSNDVKAFFLVFVLVIIAAVIAYFYLFLPLAERRNALLVENHELDNRRINLLNMAVDEDVFKLGINESGKTIKQVMNHYSAGNTPEKNIMMVERMEREVGISLPSLSFSQPTVLSTVQMPMVSEDAEGNYNIEYYDVELLQETLSTSYACTYEQLKKMVDYINAYPERMNIESISIAYDSETNGLKGNLTLNLYAVTGTGKEYTAPEINGLSMGTGNIFGQ